MKKILYIGTDQYSGLKADLITRNKIDAVNFEFTMVEKQTEEVYNKDIKIYEVKDGELKLEESIGEWGSWYADDLIYWDLKDEFQDKRFCRIERGTKMEWIGTYDTQTIPTYTVCLAVLLEPKNYFIYDANLSGFVQEIYFSDIDSVNLLGAKVNISGKIASGTIRVPVQNTIHDEPIIQTLRNLPLDTYRIHVLNEKQAFLYCKLSIRSTQDTNTYTKSIQVTLSANTWSTQKTSIYYGLKSEIVKGVRTETVERISQNYDGSFVGFRNADGSYVKFEPKNPYTYPSNELIRFTTWSPEANYTNEHLYEQIARELLTDYRNGRNSISFSLPDIKLGYVNSHGEKLDSVDEKTALDLEMGDLVILGAEKGGYVGGYYKGSISSGADVRRKKIPKQYEITGIEYNYDGGMVYTINALEKPYHQAKDSALVNGQFAIKLT